MKKFISKIKFIFRNKRVDSIQSSIKKLDSKMIKIKRVEDLEIKTSLLEDTLETIQSQIEYETKLKKINERLTDDARQANIRAIEAHKMMLKIQDDYDAYYKHRIQYLETYIPPDINSEQFDFYGIKKPKRFKEYENK